MDIPASSLVELQAEIARKKADIASGKDPKRPAKGKKAARTNRGVDLRRAKDEVVYEQEVGRQDPGRIRKVLEEKARIYEARGRGLGRGQRGEVVVDFGAEASASSSESGEDVDDDDEQVEITDEFGRTRWVPRSEAGVQEEMQVIYGDQQEFPVYAPDTEEIRRKIAEKYNSVHKRYSADGENRAKGAGFYAFSQNEETRQRQMQELKQAHEETISARLTAQERGGIEAEYHRKLEQRRRAVQLEKEALMIGGAP